MHFLCGLGSSDSRGENRRLSFVTGTALAGGGGRGGRGGGAVECCWRWGTWRLLVALLSWWYRYLLGSCHAFYIARFRTLISHPFDVFDVCVSSARYRRGRGSSGENRCLLFVNGTALAGGGGRGGRGGGVAMEWCRSRSALLLVFACFLYFVLMLLLCLLLLLSFRVLFDHPFDVFIVSSAHFRCARSRFGLGSTDGRGENRRLLFVDGTALAGGGGRGGGVGGGVAMEWCRRRGALLLLNAFVLLLFLFRWGSCRRPSLSSYMCALFGPPLGVFQVYLSSTRCRRGLGSAEAGRENRSRRLQFLVVAQPGGGGRGGGVAEEGWRWRMLYRCCCRLQTGRK